MTDQVPNVDAYMTATEAARVAGIKRDTFTAYVNRGHAPPATFTLEGRRFWARDVIAGWIGNRPGRGARTDLRRREAVAGE